MNFVRTVIFTAALLPTTAWAGGQETPSGADLHATHCTRCHDAGMYTRPQRLVNSYTELRKRVQECELGAELGWFDEEVETVVGYLNNTFYRFPVAGNPEQ